MSGGGDWHGFLFVVSFSPVLHAGLYHVEKHEEVQRYNLHVCIMVEE